MEMGLLDRQATDFYRSLFAHHQKWHNEFNTAIKRCRFIPAETPPLVRPGLLRINDEIRNLLARCLSELIDIIHEFNLGIIKGDYTGYFQDDTRRIDSLIDDVLSMNADSYLKYQDVFNIGAEELVFIAVSTLKPFFGSLMLAYASHIDQEQWYKHQCPVCGYYPDISKIDDASGGRRILHCALCEYEWIYNRIACTICGNTNSETLGYFAEEGSPYEIDYCDMCKGYIKSVKTGKFDPPEKYDLVVENILTAYLDYFAIEKGYSRP